MADERQPYRKCKKMRSFSLCPEDLPESAYVKSEKNGKTYFNFLIEEFADLDQYGNDMSISIQQSVEERKSKAKKFYVGYLKTLWTNPEFGGTNANSNPASNQASNQAPTPTGTIPQNNNFEKDLPF